MKHLLEYVWMHEYHKCMNHGKQPHKVQIG